MGYFSRLRSAGSTFSNVSHTVVDGQVNITYSATNVQSAADTDEDNVSLAVAGDISCVGKLHIDSIEADTVVETSDPRKKNFIGKMPDSDGKLALKIQPYFYELKNRPGELHAGVNAAEVDQVAPYIVTKNKKGDMAVNYRMINMHMLQNMQRQEREIQALKSTVSALK
jgi:hypothetical protein